MIEEVGRRRPKGVKLDILMTWLLVLWNTYTHFMPMATTAVLIIQDSLS